MVRQSQIIKEAPEEDTEMEGSINDEKEFLNTKGSRGRVQATEVDSGQESSDDEEITTNNDLTKTVYKNEIFDNKYDEACAKL